MSWRVGKVPLNVYDGDRPVCQCHTPEDAARIVAAMNAGSELLEALKRVGTMADEEVQRPGDNDQRFHALIRIRNFVGNSLAIANAEGA